jgi:hypothetical protein
MPDLQAQIEAQMQLYFDGLYYGDIKRLARVFAPEARYVCATGGNTVNLGMEDYFPVVAQRDPPAARSEPRRDKVVSIAFAGDRTAMVTAHCAIGERYFTDFLSFIRTAEGWRIIAKVFHFEIQLVPALTE